MAKDIELNVKLRTELDDSLKKVIEATKKVGGLTNQQKDSIDKYQKGADLALKSGDLKEFQANFNALVGVFKAVSAATGQLSKELKELTEKQADLNKKINESISNRTDLENKLTKDKKLTKSAADKFANENENAKKVFAKDGSQMSRDAIVEAQAKLAQELATAGKT